MTSQLSLYNNALLLIGERSLSSLSEARESRRQLDTAWSRDIVKECLEQGLWKFALRTVELTESPSVTPSFGHPYGFDRPTDLVRTNALCSDEFFREPLLNYQTEGAYIFASITPIYLRYVSSDTSYGGDLSLWPANFARFVEAVLAKAVAVPLTQKALNPEVVRKALKEARATDAMEEPTRFAPEGSWARARRGRGDGERGPGSSLMG